MNRAMQLVLRGTDTLDAAIEGVKARAALEGIKTPSEVARLVLVHTDHILLVGEGAKRFALSYGFKEADLLTPESRQLWLEWRANRGPGDDWLDVPKGMGMVREGALHDTAHLFAQVPS